MQPLSYQEIQKGMKSEKVYQITPEVYGGFTDIFGDKNILHVNDDYAVSHGFNAKVMHGAILNGFISHFVGMEFPCKNTIIQSVHISFKHPNFINDRLKIETVVDQKSDAVKTIILKMTITNLSQQYVAAKAKVQIGFLEE